MTPHMFAREKHPPYQYSWLRNTWGQRVAIEGNSSDPFLFRFVSVLWRDALARRSLAGTEVCQSGLKLRTRSPSSALLPFFGGRVPLLK